MNGEDLPTPTILRVGGSTGLTDCVQDCSGAWGGTAYVDGCGSCISDTNGLTPCGEDCNGDLGGTAYTDNCGTCVSGNTGKLPCNMDCHGEWGGTASSDFCGLCTGAAVAPCVQDCTGLCDGIAYEDACGVCDEDNTNDNLTCSQDCEGVRAASPRPMTAVCDTDDNNNNATCDPDCEGVYGGLAYNDGCGVCDTDADNDNTTCFQDCNGDWGGTAYVDGCAQCVAGNTGLDQCSADCAGIWGGLAVVDVCGACVGGNTGLIACNADCAAYSMVPRKRTPTAVDALGEPPVLWRAPRIATAFGAVPEPRTTAETVCSETPGCSPALRIVWVIGADSRPLMIALFATPIRPITTQPATVIAKAFGPARP